MKKIIILILIILVSILGYFYLWEREVGMTEKECSERGGKIVNTLNHLVVVETEILTNGVKNDIYGVDPKILEKNIGEVAGLKCPCICIVE